MVMRIKMLPCLELCSAFINVVNVHSIVVHGGDSLAISCRLYELVYMSTADTRQTIR